MLWKKLIRTLLHYKAQFLSMIIMIFLGAGVFCGFNAEWKSLEENGHRFFEETNYADYWVYHPSAGFSEAEVNQIKELDDITAATRKLKIDTTISSQDQFKTISLNIVEEYIISKNHVVSGQDYQNDARGFYLNDKFASENQIALNDEITLFYQQYELTGPVLGFIKNPEYLYAVEDQNQIMPDFASYGYAFITPSFFFEQTGIEFYNQILIRSSLKKEELSNVLQEIVMQNILILSREENASYTMLQSEIEEGQTMGILLPLIFLLIAILAMITTMHRITTNEKKQIGILKALGFKNRRILRHYTSYGTVVGILGVIFSLPVGFLIAFSIVNPNQFQGTCFDMPTWDIVMPLWCYFVLIGIVLLITFISFISVKKILKGSAADTLRPYVAKNIKPTKLEKSKLFQRFTFSTRWNFRDLLRNKTRSAMALIGVLGCMILLVAGFGMKNTMDQFINVLDQTIYNFDYKILLEENAQKEEVEKLQEELAADRVSVTNIQIEAKNYTLNIYDTSHDYIRVVDEKNHIVSLQKEGAYVCKRIADEFNLKKGDQFSFNLYGSSFSYIVEVAEIVKSSLEATVFINHEFALQLFDLQHIALDEQVPYSYLLSNQLPKQNNSFIQSIQNKKDVIASYDTFMEIMNFMIVILVLFALLLGFVVLYNLGSISYVERYRELATLKVVGFNNKQIASLLIRQNTWITIFGALLGVFCGYGVLYYCIVQLASEYELSVYLSVFSIFLSLILTIGTSYLVSYLISLKNKKIDMVESLKVNE